MKSAFILALFLGLSAATPAATPLEKRATSCSVDGGSGVCQSTSTACSGGSYHKGTGPNWPCPGGQDIQCCIKSQSCSVDGGTGVCQSTSTTCSGGSYHAGSGPNWPCPGGNDIQCCIKSSTGGSCSVDGGTGTCKSTSSGCSGGSFHPGTGPNWPCPGGDDVQCCIKDSGGSGGSCSVDGGTGTCKSTSSGCSGGSFHPGSGPNWPCPGSDDIQCCIKDGSGSIPKGTEIGAQVLAKAKTAAGVPYAWAGGSCSGPTGDQPPYDYGDIGYDCSGLVCWALCQVSGRNLFSEGLRVTYVMYCASESKLGYKKYPFSERKAGDAVFFGGKCDCSSDRTGIHHVALMMDSGDRIWNAPQDPEVVKEGSIQSHRNNGDPPCPYVIRFTK